MTDTFVIQDLCFSYPEQSGAILQDINLNVRQGEFLVLCGPSGCGKSTLLRQLKTVLAPHGWRSGTTLFEGKPLDSMDQRQQTERIGFVQQSPDNQIVTDKVWHELAFGLESLGYETSVIRQRVAEMAAFFGIESWFYKNVAELSGGQKQLLNLASVMAMQPSVLILDEPTSQLNPIAAADFLATLGRINRELGHDYHFDRASFGRYISFGYQGGRHGERTAAVQRHTCGGGRCAAKEWTRYVPSYAHSYAGVGGGGTGGTMPRYGP